MAELATSQELEQYQSYRLVDDIPEVALARQVERTAAIDVLNKRRQEYQQGQETEVFLPVDALSTGFAVLEARQVYGQSSNEYTDRYAGLVLDCQRLVAEWYRKKKPEYFPPVRHIFDAETEEFFSHGLSIRQMTENALTPIGDNSEEEARRINERVEDATPQLLRKLGKIALGSESIRTISECTDEAIAAYAEDISAGASHRGYGGYVPEIEKVMIRDIRLDATTDDRFEEQIGLPGLYVNHFVIQKALERQGASVGHMDKTELHGSQLLVKDDLMDFVKLLDDVASSEWCTNIFMGEVVESGFIKNYDSFRSEALYRQEGLKDLAHTTANFVLSLAEEGVDRRKAPALVEEFVKKLLINLARKDTSVAEQIFDDRTAFGLKEVAYFESIGDYDQAFIRLQEVEKAAPGGGYCGAGSCGLESVDIHSDSGKDLLKKLKADPGDTVLKDKERACRCGKKNIVYAFNKNKVTKYCEGCNSFESKVSKAA